MVERKRLLVKFKFSLPNSPICLCWFPHCHFLFHCIVAALSTSVSASNTDKPMVLYICIQPGRISFILFYFFYFYLITSHWTQLPEGLSAGLNQDIFKRWPPIAKRPNKNRKYTFSSLDWFIKVSLYCGITSLTGTQVFVMPPFKFRAAVISDKHTLHNNLNVFELALALKAGIMNASALVWFKVYNLS